MPTLSEESPIRFEDKNEFGRTVEQLMRRPSEVAREKAIPILAGRTSILDILQKLQAVKTKKGFEDLLARHSAFFELAQDKDNSSKLSFLKSNPILASLASESGEIRVGKDAYNVFDPGDVQSLKKMRPMPELEPGTGSGGETVGISSSYTFTEEPPEWMVQSLPCGPWTVLPGYPTKFFDVAIGGRTVRVQLWKGSCPDYVGQGAGGVGAEVGLYNRDTWMPNTFWWPDYKHKKNMSFTLVNPRTNAPFFSASSPGPIWWLHKWMKFPSYDQYVMDQNRNVPASTAEYILRYSIDGRSFSW